MYYYGQRVGRIGHALAMLLNIQDYEIPFINNLCCEGLYLNYDIKNFKQRSDDYSCGCQAIGIALKNLNIYEDIEIREVSSNDSYHEWLKVIVSLLKKGKILVGPVNMQWFWNRLEQTYYNSDSYFLCLLDIDSEDYFIINDPQEAPYLRISKEVLHKQLNKRSYCIYAATKKPHSFDSEEIAKNILNNAISIRKQIWSEKENIVTENVDTIIGLINENSQHSSKMATFFLGISDMNVSLAYLKCFIEELLCSKWANKYDLKKLLVIVNKYIEIIAMLMLAIRTETDKNIVECLKEISKLEVQLNELFFGTGK